MKSRLNHFAAISVLIALIISSCATNKQQNQAISINDFYERFISHIAANLSSEYDLKFAVLSFESTKEDDRDSAELGIYLAESIASQISMNLSESTLFERENLEIILEEHDFNLSGYIDSNQAMEVGKLIPVNALLTGKYTILNDTITINCRLIDVKTGEILIAYYDSVELTKDLSTLSGKEWEEAKQPEVETLGPVASGNGNSLFFTKSLQVTTDIIPFDSYLLIAEDKENDFSKYHAFGTSKDPAGDIKDVYYFEDDTNYYFLINFHNALSLQEINVNLNFMTPTAEYDTYSIIINSHGINIDTNILYFDGDSAPINLDKNFRFRIDKEIEILIPKRVFEKTPTELLILARTQRAKEIDRLNIDLGSNSYHLSKLQTNLMQAEPIRVEKEITIDGKLEDWTNTKPVAVDPYNDTLSNQDNQDITAVYLARDNKYLYVRVDVAGDRPNAIGDGITYDLTFEINNKHYELWCLKEDLGTAIYIVENDIEIGRWEAGSLCKTTDGALEARFPLSKLKSSIDALINIDPTFRIRKSGTIYDECSIGSISF